MRTNVVIDDELLKQAMQLSGIKTKRGTIDEALRTFVRLQSQKAILALEGAIAWEGDLSAMRATRLIAEEPVDYDASSS